MKNLLKDLVSIDGVSGNENLISDYCVEFLSKYADVTKDFNNNVIAILGDKNAEKTILLDAHLDQIGFIVTYINENGFIKVGKCGGIDLRTLLGSPVRVCGKDNLKGIICCMPPHLTDGKEDEAVSGENLWVDLGLPYDEVIKNVAVGDYIAFDNKYYELLNEKISSPSLDNRAGVATLLKLCQLLCNVKLDIKVVILLSCQEETYAVGAITKSFEITPNEAISVDVSFASQKGITDQYSDIELEKGPMICISSTLNKEMSNKFINIAKDQKIPYQIEVCGGKTGTNADHISISKNGVKTCVLSIPQKNMHTQVEIISLKDIENTAKLLYKYIISGGVK